MKPCPHCSREIEDDALVCPFCRRGVREPTLTPAQTIARLKKANQPSRWPLIILILAAIGSIVGYLVLSRTLNFNGNSQDVWRAGEVLLALI